MIVTELWAQILISFLGGCAGELFHWYSLARTGKRVRAYLKKPLYWATTIGMILVGGIMPVLYNSGSANAALCFHLGASTPLLLAKLIGNLPTGTTIQAQGANDSSAPTFREFMDW